jgi:hypothetical protein
MEKNLCSLVVLNLKNVTRIVGSNILPGKSSGLVHFRNTQQLKLALKLQENNSIVIKTEIPTDILMEVDPVYAQQQTVVEPVQKEVQPEKEKAEKSVIEEAAEVEVKSKRKKKNS